MKAFTRRNVLLTSAAAFCFGAVPEFVTSGAAQTQKGWHTLPLGCGGLITGFDIAPDGTMVCRTDVGNAYRFTGTTATVTDPSKRWVPLMTFSSMGPTQSRSSGTYNGAYELVVAPSRTSRIFGIFPDNGRTAATWALYYSNNSGETWEKTSVVMQMPNGGSNGPWKTSTRKIAIDPNNADIIYCGMPNKLADQYSVYVAFDGKTFSPIQSIGPTIFDPGVCGILFDKSRGTVNVNGQTRTARIIVPVGGVGIFESLDGGQTFKEIAIAATRRADISVHKAQMDYDGVYYCIMIYGGAPNKGYVWRYSGPNGTWAQLDAQAGWRLGSGWIGGNSSSLIVDPRKGHQGYLSLFGPNGIGTGFTSTNANALNPATITWGGGTGGQSSTLSAPSYDVSWLNHVTRNGSGAFVYGPDAVIDDHGTCWWCGNQGALWRFTESDLTTPSIPNYAVSRKLFAVSTSRGTEVTVAQDVLRPPGGPYPILGAQDVGVFQSSFDPTKYPTDYYPSPTRLDCDSLTWAVKEPSCVAARLSVEVSDVASGARSAYSLRHGETGSWVPYAKQADLMYQAVFTGSISNGAGGPGNILNVTEVSGHIMPGQQVYVGRSEKGTITGYGSGTGGLGTYTVNKPTYYVPFLPFTSFKAVLATQGGQIVAIDRDRHIVVPSGYNGSFVPVYTLNATSSSCAWEFCRGLPQIKWTNRSFIYGATAKPLALDFVNIGTAYACAWSATTTSTIYRSTDSGANWTAVGNLQIGDRGNYTSVFLNAARGFAGDLWLTAQFTGGRGSGLWRSTDGGEKWISVAMPPSPFNVPKNMCLGAPEKLGGYPTIYLEAWGGWSTHSKLFYSTDQGRSWAIFGATGTTLDLPPSCQIAGIQSFTADWEVFGQLYVCSGQSGFAYYQP